MNIPNITLNNGSIVPQLGFGTWKIYPHQGARRIVGEALGVGYRHIDTARIYLNERSVGHAIQDSQLPREELFVTTKLWNNNQRHADKALAASLKRLQLDYVDLYLMHFPVSKTRLQAWEAMEKIYTSGQAKAIGVSNFTIRHLEELLSKTNIVPAVNQVEFHPFLYQKDLLEYCQQKGIALEAYSPLAHGARMGHTTITKLAKTHNKSNAQIMIRWSIQHGNIVIPKSKSPERMRQNLQVFDFVLTQSEMTQLNNLNENLRTCLDPTNVI